MARVRYRGDHPEPSVAIRIFAEPIIQPWPVMFDASVGYQTRRIETVCLPRGVWRAVNPFIAIWLAAVRRRHGPWIDVRISPPEWREIRRRAPWLRKAVGRLSLDPDDADDAIHLNDPQIAEGLRMASVRAYQATAGDSLAGF